MAESPRNPSVFGRIAERDDEARARLQDRGMLAQTLGMAKVKAGDAADLGYSAATSITAATTGGFALGALRGIAYGVIAMVAGSLLLPSLMTATVLGCIFLAVAATTTALTTYGCYKRACIRDRYKGAKFADNLVPKDGPAPAPALVPERGPDGKLLPSHYTVADQTIYHNPDSGSQFQAAARSGAPAAGRSA